MKVKLSELFFLLRTAASTQKIWLYTWSSEKRRKKKFRAQPRAHHPCASYPVFMLFVSSICRYVVLPKFCWYFISCCAECTHTSWARARVGYKAQQRERKHRKAGERKEVKHTIFSSKFAALCYGRDRAERRKIQHEKNWNENCAEKRFVHPGSLCCCLTLFFFFIFLCRSSLKYKMRMRNCKQKKNERRSESYFFFELVAWVQLTVPCEEYVGGLNNTQFLFSTLAHGSFIAQKKANHKKCMRMNSKQTEQSDDVDEKTLKMRAHQTTHELKSNQIRLFNYSRY